MADVTVPIIRFTRQTAAGGGPGGLALGKMMWRGFGLVNAGVDHGPSDNMDMHVFHTRIESVTLL